MFKSLLAVIGVILGTASAIEPPYQIGSGWVPVPFTSPGTLSTAYFSFSSDNSTLVSFTDTGAIGDTYWIYNNGVFLAASSLPNQENLAGTSTDDPDVAFTTQLGWSKAFIILNEGTYNLTVAWNSKGAVDDNAFIRVDYNYNT